MGTIWVLTEERNDYNQYGEYFITCWKEKPSLEDLTSILRASGDDGTRAERLLNPTEPGEVLRINDEDIWYILDEIKEGTTG